MLKLSQVNYLYDPKTIDGLHGIDLELKQGETLGLMGPSGSGKSTLAKVIKGEINPSSGTIENLAKNILYLEDSLLKPELSVLENFINYAYGDTEDQRITKARMACSDLEITNYINKKVCQLSTGQFQRTLLGLAYVSKAQLVILDEPFSHLEYPLRQELIESIFPAFKNNGTSVLWISHDQKLLMSHCERIAILNYGKIQQIDSPEKLYFFPQNLFVAQFLGDINIIQHKQQFMIFRPSVIEVLKLKEEGEILEAKLVNQEFTGDFYKGIFSTELGEVLCVYRAYLELQDTYYLKIDYSYVQTKDTI